MIGLRYKPHLVFMHIHKSVWMNKIMALMGRPIKK